jgi:hypothetical protein
MRKLRIIMSMIILSGFLMGCETAKPLENVQIDAYESIHKNTHYEVFVRSDMDINKTYVLIGYEISSKRSTTCTVGLDVLENYIFLYHDAYYHIIEASKLNIFTGQDLMDIGMNVTCK